MKDGQRGATSPSLVEGVPLSVEVKPTYRKDSGLDAFQQIDHRLPSNSSLAVVTVPVGLLSKMYVCALG